MFIDVTRHGGVMLLRLSTAAIAYISETPTGSAIHLIGGETIRANESREEIEARIVALSTSSSVWINPPSGPAPLEAKDPEQVPMHQPSIQARPTLTPPSAPVSAPGRRPQISRKKR